jgi:hypothetical protein
MSSAGGIGSNVAETSLVLESFLLIMLLKLEMEL